MSGQARQSGSRLAIDAYSFDELPKSPPESAAWDLPRLDGNGIPVVRTASEDGAIATKAEDWQGRLAEEARRSFEAGRQRGMEDGRAAERAIHAPADQNRAEQLRRLLDDIASGRDKYLQAVEEEVVRLALAIAARILRREAQTDPLLLMGAVRVALGQLAAATEVRLHVPAADAALWNEAVRLVPNLTVRVTVVSEDALSLGECRLETDLGEVDLGLRPQLGEIERGFFDRATASPVKSLESLQPVESMP